MQGTGRHSVWQSGAKRYEYDATLSVFLAAAALSMLNRLRPPPPRLSTDAAQPCGEVRRRVLVSSILARGAVSLWRC
jgi:hypothetical protein